MGLSCTIMLIYSYSQVSSGRINRKEFHGPIRAGVVKRLQASVEKDKLGIALLKVLRGKTL
jgi:hypothetical protein